MDFEVNKTMENGRKCYGAETKKHSLGTSLYDFSCLRKAPAAFHDRSGAEHSHFRTDMLFSH